MKDSLKEFIDANRDQFDGRLPANSLWKRIESNLPGKHQTLWNSLIIWRAAAALLLGLSIYLAVAQRQTSFKASKQLTVEFTDLDLFYNSQIAEKAELVSQFQQKSAEADDEITQHLQKLEAMYQVLKLEIINRPTQEVKDALILNLLVRIDLLNQQLNKLDRREEATESANKSI